MRQGCEAAKATLRQGCEKRLEAQCEKDAREKAGERYWKLGARQKAKQLCQNAQREKAKERKAKQRYQLICREKAKEMYKKAVRESKNSDAQADEEGEAAVQYQEGPFARTTRR